jgi:hypothetical protein
MTTAEVVGAAIPFSNFRNCTMKQTTHGQHNKHNVLKELARTDEDALQYEGLAGEVAVVGRLRLTSMEAIRHHAYGKWETAGKPEGDGIAFWLESEKELTAVDKDHWGVGNSQDADRHSEIRHPHSLKM